MISSSPSLPQRTVTRCYPTPGRSDVPEPQLHSGAGTGVHKRAAQVWSGFRNWTRVTFPIPDDNFGSSENWWINARRGIPKAARRNFDTMTILIYWRIWKERNAMIFQQVASSVDRVLELIQEDITVWRSAGCVGDIG
ncbi:uncharacterized protein [Triticum aestivum]|uniref:uncharacterized protein n=1 Tax=Triticum aestivum TaxID=4565 RepID=UPI001D026384|nr:uncharacterized protein LOC123128426 [Triticum aestivum]